jgi:hypothetical protein
MDKATLVDLDLKKGEKIVVALEDNGLPLMLALWVHFPEYEDWRFVVASRKLDPLSPGDAYLRVIRALNQAGFTVRESPALLIMKTTDPFVRELRKVFGKAASVVGMRLGGQRWGDRIVDDAYAYKIA